MRTNDQIVDSERNAQPFYDVKNRFSHVRDSSKNRQKEESLPFARNKVPEGVAVKLETLVPNRQYPVSHIVAHSSIHSRFANRNAEGCCPDCGNPLQRDGCAKLCRVCGFSDDCA